jgi:AbrB family looped-hinge helix DNA binding protein
MQVNITPSGRMSLPAEVRKRLGLSGGGAVLIEETDDGLVLRTVAQAVLHAQRASREFTAGKGGASVDDFIAGRRSEAGE